MLHVIVQRLDFQKNNNNNKTYFYAQYINTKIEYFTQMVEDNMQSCTVQL
jgi:hypothetical protein